MKPKGVPFGFCPFYRTVFVIILLQERENEVYGAFCRKF